MKLVDNKRIEWNGIEYDIFFLMCKAYNRRYWKEINMWCTNKPFTLFVFFKIEIKFSQKLGQN